MIRFTVYLLVAAVFLALGGVYHAWTTFEREVRRAKAVPTEGARKAAARVGIYALLAGIALGLFGVAMRLSVQGAGFATVGDQYGFLVSGVLCAISPSLLAVAGFWLKIVELRARYRDKSPGDDSEG